MKTDSAKWCLFIGNLLFYVIHSVPTYQKSLGIDSVRCAGQKCYKIFAFLYCKGGSFFRFDNGNLIHFIT